MVSRRWRKLVLAPAFVVASGMMTLATVSVGTAQAGNYTNSLIGPFSTQSACAADAAAANDPPDTLVSACRFETDHPGTNTPDPGWYFNLHILITP
jgi:hypothetical protein